MDWAAISAIGEIIGALAVVVSLIYVSLQLRAGTQALQTATRDSVFKSLLEWNYAVMGEPRLAWINQAGALDFQALDEEDRARYMQLMYTFLKMFENIFLHHLEGALGKSIWESNLPLVSAYLTQPGARYYWEKRRSSFDPRFNAVIENLRPSEVEFGAAISGVAEALTPHEDSGTASAE
jgi:hypothetical protein